MVLAWSYCSQVLGSNMDDIAQPFLNEHRAQRYGSMVLRLHGHFDHTEDRSVRKQWRHET